MQPYWLAVVEISAVAVVTVSVLQLSFHTFSTLLLKQTKIKLKNWSSFILYLLAVLLVSMIMVPMAAAVIVLCLCFGEFASLLRLFCVLPQESVAMWRSAMPRH